MKTLTQTIESISDGKYIAHFVVSFLSACETNVLKKIVKKLGAWLLDFQKSRKGRSQNSTTLVSQNDKRSPNLPTSILQENIPITNSSQMQMQPVPVQVQSNLDMGGVSNYNVSNDMGALPLEEQPNFNYPVTRTSNNDIEMMKKIFKNYPG